MHHSMWKFNTQTLSGEKNTHCTHRCYCTYPTNSLSEIQLEFDKPLLDDGAPNHNTAQKIVLGQLQAHNDTLLVIIALDGNNTAGRSTKDISHQQKVTGALEHSYLMNCLPISKEKPWSFSEVSTLLMLGNKVVGVTDFVGRRDKKAVLVDGEKTAIS